MTDTTTATSAETTTQHAADSVVEQSLSDEQLLQWKPCMGMLSVTEKIEQADTLKRQANVYFKRAELKKALASYAKVFAYVNGLSVQGDAMSQYAGQSANMSATSEQGEQIQALKIAVWANMAFCHLKLERGAKALEFCDKVLAEDATHSKALFRKAQAMAMLEHFDRAVVLLTELARAEPRNVAVRTELRSVQERKKVADAAARAKEKSVFGSMFSKK